MSFAARNTSVFRLPTSDIKLPIFFSYDLIFPCTSSSYFKNKSSFDCNIMFSTSKFQLFLKQCIFSSLFYHIFSRLHFSINSVFKFIQLCWQYLLVWGVGWQDCWWSWVHYFRSVSRRYYKSWIATAWDKVRGLGCKIFAYLMNKVTNTGWTCSKHEGWKEKEKRRKRKEGGRQKKKIPQK